MQKLSEKALKARDAWGDLAESTRQKVMAWQRSVYQGANLQSPDMIQVREAICKQAQAEYWAAVQAARASRELAEAAMKAKDENVASLFGAVEAWGEPMGDAFAKMQAFCGANKK
jgi:hypothetical protein